MSRNTIIGLVAGLVVLTSVTSFILGYGLSRQQGIPVVPTLAPTVFPTDSLSIYPTANPSISQEVPVTPTNSQSYIREQIVAAVTSRNTAALQGYMAETVSVRIENSGCCGPLSAEEATSQLSYLNNASGPWTFDDTNVNIVALRAASQYYASPAVVGVSPDKYATSFQFDGQGKISGISMSVDYSLLLNP